MVERSLDYQKKAQSHWLFIIMCTLFLSLYILRDIVGVGIHYYIIYAVALLTVMIVSAEEAICFFMAISAFTNAGLDGVFCTALFACILLRFLFVMRTIKLHSALLILFVLIELLHFLGTRKVAIGVYLTYAMILLSLMIVQQYPQEKLDKVFIINTFIAFAVVYVSIVVISVAMEHGSIAKLIEQGLRTEEYQEIKGNNFIAPNQNYLTQMCSLGIALCVLLLRKKYAPAMYICAIIVFLVCGLLTVSKSFMVVLVALALYITVMVTKRNSLAGVCVVAGLMIVAAAIEHYFGDTLIKMVIERFKTEDLTTGRLDINRKLLEYMDARPWLYLLGSGVLQVHFLTDMAVHSSIFELLGGWGVGGFFLVAAYVLLLIKEARENIKKEDRKIDGFGYLPLLLLFCYTINGMLFSQQFTIVQISVCIFAMQVREKNKYVV